MKLALKISLTHIPPVSLLSLSNLKQLNNFYHHIDCILYLIPFRLHIRRIRKTRRNIPVTFFFSIIILYLFIISTTDHDWWRVFANKEY